MNLINTYADKILNYLHSQYPILSEIMMPEIIENLGDKSQFDAFMGAMEFLVNEGYLSYQNSTCGRQFYSMVILTEKGLSIFEGRGRYYGIGYRPSVNRYDPKIEKINEKEINGTRIRCQ